MNFLSENTDYKVFRAMIYKEYTNQDVEWFW